MKVIPVWWSVALNVDVSRKKQSAVEMSAVNTHKYASVKTHKEEFWDT